jgi:hypothetical protein
VLQAAASEAPSRTLPPPGEDATAPNQATSTGPSHDTSRAEPECCYVERSEAMVAEDARLRLALISQLGNAAYTTTAADVLRTIAAALDRSWRHCHGRSRTGGVVAGTSSVACGHGGRCQVEPTSGAEVSAIPKGNPVCTCPVRAWQKTFPKEATIGQVETRADHETVQTTEATIRSRDVATSGEVVGGTCGSTDPSPM